MAKANVDLICSIGELAGLFQKSTSLEDFLQTAVSIVAYHMRAAVCSVYLYDETTNDLTLTATQGLSPASIGRVRLKLGEGLTGRSLKELRPIREGTASQSPFFKFIPGIHEEQFQAFLAVPILRGLSRVGVLVAQDPVHDYFDENDTKALQAIAAQLASVIENAKLLMTLHRMQEETEPPRAAPAVEPELKFMRGVPGAGGIAMGQAGVFGSIDDDVTALLGQSGSGVTRADFQRSLANTEKQLEDLQTQMEERLADVASMIFSAHILIVKDPKFSGAMLAHIEEGMSPPEAINHVVGDYIRLFAASSNPRLREKVQDLKDLGRRLLKNLRNDPEVTADYKGRVIIAAELLPSDILKLVAQCAEGLVLVSGGATSHIAILSRSLQLPMVILDDRRLLSLTEHHRLVIDGDQGTLYVNPGPDVTANYQTLLTTNREAERFDVETQDRTCTACGARVDVLANINMLSEVKLALRFKASGVGLYRSEFPFIVRSDFPSEEEQFRIYRQLLDTMDGHDVTFRTLDVGGDKMLSYFPSVNEANPFLGLRALRFSLRYRDIFTRQLRALLRAGAGYPLQIMFPMVSSVDDFLQARAVVEDCLRQLEAEKIQHQGAPKLGAMVELPSVVEIVEELAHEADFLSIGGNDLVQYMLAVDRTNEHISDLYVSYHPAVLRALRRIAAAAIRLGKPLSFCGEMASDPKIIPFLLGIGIRRLSVEARQIARVQQVIRGLNLATAEADAKRILTFGRISEVAAALGIESRSAAR